MLLFHLLRSETYSNKGHKCLFYYFYFIILGQYFCFYIYTYILFFFINAIYICVNMFFFLLFLISTLFFLSILFTILLTSIQFYPLFTHLNFFMTSILFPYHLLTLSITSIHHRSLSLSLFSPS